MSVRHRVYEILEADERGDRVSRIVDFAILGLIVLNVAAVLLETVQSIYDAWQPYFRSVEVFSIVVFSIEYALRLWSCTEDPRFEGRLAGRLRFIVSPSGLIDLLAIGPFFVAPHVDFRLLRALRLFRLLRLAKPARYSTALRTFGRVLGNKREELVIMLSFLLVLLLRSSALMYSVEHPARPEEFSSIPAAMWWGVATLTTVGYGDAYPVAPIGKVLASAIAILGIGLFALPAGILGSAFVEDLQRQRAPRSSCPRCGKSLKETVVQ